MGLSAHVSLPLVHFRPSRSANNQQEWLQYSWETFRTASPKSNSRASSAKLVPLSLSGLFTTERPAVLRVSASASSRMPTLPRMPEVFERLRNRRQNPPSRQRQPQLSRLRAQVSCSPMKTFWEHNLLTDSSIHSIHIHSSFQNL